MQLLKERLENDLLEVLSSLCTYMTCFDETLLAFSICLWLPKSYVFIGVGRKVVSISLMRIILVFD